MISNIGLSAVKGFEFVGIEEKLKELI